MATALHFVSASTICAGCGSPTRDGSGYCPACARSIDRVEPIPVLLLSNLRNALKSPRPSMGGDAHE